MAITSVLVRTNESLRPSRLIRSMASYVKRSVMTIIRIFIIYKPFLFFMTIGLLLLFTGFCLGLRFIYYVYIIKDGTSRIQSLILASILLGIGFQTILVAFLADLIAANRKLTEDVQYRLRKIDLDKMNDKKKPNTQ